MGWWSVAYLYNGILFSSNRNELLICAKTWMNLDSVINMKEARHKEYILSSTICKVQE